MLVRENRGRDQDRHLFPALDRLERRPHRHLGLPVPDVTDQKAVHRHRALHVAFHVLGGPALVGRILVEECRFQLPLPAGVRRRGVTRADGPAGIELQQLHRHLLDRFAGFFSLLLPGGAAEPVQLGGVSSPSPPGRGTLQLV